ncbi:uncharacterized protein LOC120659656 [Panicum virgatum]|uniref:uncharacterized protein LOC120659656 n=1 Tax=Panicum virgatum TaxID=38727 RepID=UPI0019D63904|nr:uncharacterized protein LOC120659656 [Panicum virgatum]
MSAQLLQTESGQSDATDNSITEVSPLLTVVPSQEAPSQTVTSTGFMTPVTKVSADELMMERAMRCTAERNLDGPIVHQHRGSAQPTPTHFSAGDLLYNTLATHVGYPSAVYLAGRPCSGVSFFGAGGQVFFCPGTWVAV